MVRGSGQLEAAKVEATRGTCLPVPRSNEEPAVSQSRGDAIQDAGRGAGCEETTAGRSLLQT